MRRHGGGSVPVFVLGLLALGLVPARAVASQFVLRMGADTVTVERCTRTPDRLEGTLLFRAAGVRFEYGLTLGAGATVSSARTSVTRANAPEGSAPEQVAEIAFIGDSAFANLVPGGMQHFGTTPGVVPYLNPSMAMIEQAVRRARALGGDTVSVKLFALAGGRTFPCRVSRRGADSVVVDLGGVEMRLAVNAAGELTGGTIPVQHLEILRSETAAGPLAVAKADYSAPATAPYRAIDVRVPTPGGFELAGTLTLPRATNGRVPCVVTITGSGLEDRDESLPMVQGYRPFRQVAEALARRGVATLRLDDRGFGDSGGDPGSASTADFADDVRAALAWLRKRPEVDGRRLALLGHSEGAIIAPLVASTDTLLRAIVLLAAPARTGRRVIEYQNRYALERDASVPAARRDSLVRSAMLSVDSLAAGSPWLRFFLGYDPLLVAPRVHVPVLIVQGETDRQVEPAQAGELAAALRAGGNRDVTVRKLPGLDHLFLPDPSGDPAGYAQLKVRQVPAEVLALIADWTAARLK